MKLHSSCKADFVFSQWARPRPMPMNLTFYVKYCHVIFEVLQDMDLETENRIACMLLKEADELRRQAQQDGVLAYLHRPAVRGRPNSRFLNATIRGVEHANRVVEMDEMWRARQKELEMEARPKSKSIYKGCHGSRDTVNDISRNRSNRHDPNATCSSSKRSYEEHRFMEDSCLKDEDLEEFLQSRVKRGRGSVGSRMDETGPYLSRSSQSQDRSCTGSYYFHDKRPPQRASLGPERPLSLKRFESSDKVSEEKHKTTKKASTRGLHSKRQKSNELDKKKKKNEKRDKS